LTNFKLSIRNSQTMAETSTWHSATSRVEQSSLSIIKCIHSFKMLSMECPWTWGLEVTSIQINEDYVVDGERSNSAYLNPQLCRRWRSSSFLKLLTVIQSSKFHSVMTLWLMCKHIWNILFIQCLYMDIHCCLFCTLFTVILINLLLTTASTCGVEFAEQFAFNFDIWTFL